MTIDSSALQYSNIQHWAALVTTGILQYVPLKNITSMKYYPTEQRALTGYKDNDIDIGHKQNIHNVIHWSGISHLVIKTDS